MEVILFMIDLKAKLKASIYCYYIRSSVGRPRLLFTVVVQRVRIGGIDPARYSRPPGANETIPFALRQSLSPPVKFDRFNASERLFRRDRLQQPVDVGGSVVGVGTDPQSADAATDHNAPGQARLADRVRIAAGQFERHDAGTMVPFAVRDDRCARRGEPLAGQIGDGENPPCDIWRPNLVDEFQTRAQPEQAGHVLRASLEAFRRRLEVERDPGEIVRDAVPADAVGTHLV